MSRLLALDIATNVGHARMVRGQVPTFGTLRLEGPDLTWKCGQLLEFLYDEYDRAPFDGIAFERPILTPTDTVKLLELLYGLIGVVFAFIGDMRQREVVNLAWCEVSVDDAKVALCGKLYKTGTRKKVDKADMIHAARTTMGWRVVTDHEADAGACGIVAFSRLWPKRPPREPS